MNNLISEDVEEIYKRVLNSSIRRIDKPLRVTQINKLQPKAHSPCHLHEWTLCPAAALQEPG